MLEDSAVSRILWPALATIAGAITSLSFRPFQKMTRGEIGMAVFVGATFSMFVGPLITGMVPGGSLFDIYGRGAIFYLTATSANSLIPLGVKKLSQFFNLKSEDDQ